MLKFGGNNYSITIDEERGLISSFSVNQKEYGERPLFKLKIKDENLESRIIEASNGKLKLSEKTENGCILKYGDFGIADLSVTVTAVFSAEAEWEIKTDMDKRFYIEWIEYPNVASKTKSVWVLKSEDKPDVNNARYYENGQRTTFDYSTIPSLAKVHEDYFRVAVAIEPRDMIFYKDLILSQFNELTTENRLKPTNVHPAEDVYSWAGADQIVEFANKHNLPLRGHGLVYEKVMPSWFYLDENNKRASKELVMDRLEKHIKTIVGRYKGKIQCYDIVNEIFGHEDWDTRELTDICGIGFVPLAYKWAHETDPDATLILNDNFHDIPKKRQNIFNYVKKMIDDGVPIHGVGFQDHLFMDTSLEAVEETLKLFSTIPNLKIYITELDLNVYNFEDYTSRYPDYMKEEILELAARKYASLFDIYRKYAHHVETVGFWNVCDAREWLDEYYVRGRRHYALPFDTEGKPRKSFWGIVDLEKKLPRWEGGTKIPKIRNNNYVIDENGTLTVSGEDTFAGHGTVKAELYSNFGKKVLCQSKTKCVLRDYEFDFDMNADMGYDGLTSPDYILEVTLNDGNIKRDSFTYYTKTQKNYTVTDTFEDFEKVYRAEFCELKKDKNGKNYVMPKWFWGNGTFGTGKIIYHIPEDYSLKQLQIDAVTQNSKLYNIYFSKDDSEYELLKMDWQISNDGDIQTICGKNQIDSDDIRFIMIDVSNNFSTYWRAYEAKLYSVKIDTKRKDK